VALLQAGVKGEELDTVSREAQVPVHELERWRRIFLEGRINGFKRRDTPGTERELERVQDDEARDRRVVPGKKGYGEELKKLKRSGKL
jgi:hypothetical protein